MARLTCERLTDQLDVCDPLGVSSPAEEDDCFEQGVRFDQCSGHSRLNKLLNQFRLYTIERGDEFDLDELPILSSGKSHQHENSFRRIRRCGRWISLRILARSFVALSLLVLLFFGVIHVLEVVVGRASLLWNRSIYEQSFIGRHSFLNNPASYSGYDGDVRKAMIPIPCHSHNDYWRDVPLFEAIRWGCIGVEADVWLFDDELYVGHTDTTLAMERTLRTLYINPLLELLAPASSTSRAFPGTFGVFDTSPFQTLVLLIDIKNAPREALQLVQEQIQPLRDRRLLSYWNGERVYSKAITVVATGDAPFEMIVNNTSYRDIFFDAPLDALWEPPREPIDHSDPLHSDDGDMDYGMAMALAQENGFATESALYNATTSYYASTSFQSSVGFAWRGHLSPRQMDIIRGQIRGAKRRGLKARYWGTPTWPTALRNHIWHVLIKEGADVLSVDDLKAAALQDWTIPVHDSSFW